MSTRLFRDSIGPSPCQVGSSTRYSIPLSILAHAAAVGALVVAPLMATGALPTPASVLVFATPTKPPLPSLPPVSAASAPQVTAEPANPGVVSTSAPLGIVRDPLPWFGPGAATPGDVGLPTIDGAAHALVAPPPIVAPAPPGTQHVGGQIKEPQKIKDVRPIYPPVARAAHVSGTVVLEAVIGPDGRVQSVTVLTSVPLLDRAAIEAVRQWVFTPTTLNGVAVPVSMTVTLHFTLQ